MTQGVKEGSPSKADELRQLLTAPPTEECIIWWGTRGPKGYSYVNFEGRRWLAHRLIATWKEGRMLSLAELALHSCDSPPCVNPLHISVGSQSDNMRQCVERSRHIPSGVSGEEHPNSKLTASDVKDIRRRYGAGVSQGALAAEFGITQANVSYIITRKGWTHVN